MVRSFLPRTVIALVILLFLLSSLPGLGTSASETSAPLDTETRYRLVTAEDLPALMAATGIRDPGVDYNVIIGGLGTGLAPPSEEEWERAIGNMYLDLGTDGYEVPTASSLDLSVEPYFPEVRSQGSEGSCAAFSLTYYNYGYIEAKDQGWTSANTGNNSQLLSPSWTYNKVNGPGHEGSNFQENARIIKQLGAATWASYPYLASDDEGLGPEAAWRSAPLHRISAYTSVFNPSPSTVVSLIKEQLGLGRPISFAMDANQYSSAFADGNKIMSAQEYVHASYNHGQTIVGYDDAISDDGDVGAFKVVNSWGKSWGQGGYYYITYGAIKEMLGYPLVYLADLPDHRPTMLATWTFSSAPSVEASLEVGVGSSASPQDKVSTYFTTGSSNLMCPFMAMDVSTFSDEYSSGATNFYLKVGSASTTGTVSSFQLELHQGSYSTAPGAVVARSTEVPRSVPGTVNAGLVQTDVIPPTSQLEALPDHTNSAVFQVSCQASDAGGSGLAHWELYYRFNSSGSYALYAPSVNPSGAWTSPEISFDAYEASGQGAYHFYSIGEDGEGNREQAPGSPDARTTVDLDAPITSAVPSGIAGLNGWYISTVSVSLSAEDRISGVERTEYRLNGGSWTVHSAALQLGQGVHLLEFRSLDRAGNLEGTQDLEIRVDTAPPTISAHANATAVNGWFRNAVGVTLSVIDALDPSCALLYRLDGGGWTEYAGAVTVAGEGEHLLEFEAQDDAGNLGQGSMVIRIDSTVPSSQASAEGVLGSGGRHLGAVSLTLQGDDVGSGVDLLRYRLNGGAWSVYSSPVQLTEDGHYVLEHYASDRAGNMEGVRSLEVTIDSRAPVISVRTDSVPENGWYRSAVNVSLTATDAMDGARAVQFSLDGGPWQTASGTVTVTGEGQHTLEYRSTDLAGNQATGSLSLDIDTTAPGSEHQVQGELGEEGRYTSAVLVSISAIDAGSGVQEIRFRLNGGAWTAYSSAVALAEDGVHLLEYYAADRAGNAGPVTRVEVLIDSHGPGVSIIPDRQPSSHDWFDGPVVITLGSVDHFDQGCPVYFRWEGDAWGEYSSPLEISAEGTHLLECYAVDLAGNQGEVMERTFRLDLVQPTCSAEVSGTLGLNGIYVSEVQVNVTAQDQMSGVAAVHMRINSGAWTVADGAVTVTAQGLTVVEFYAEDRAGNAGPIGAVHMDIDTVAPSVLAVTDRPAREGWYASEVNVTLSTDEEGCVMQYRLGSGDWAEYGTSIAIHGHGLTLLEFHAVDRAGNEGPLQGMELRLDLVAPQVSASLEGTEGDNGYYVSAVNLTALAEDEGSGASAILYRVNGGEWSTWKGSLWLGRGGTHLVEIYALDLAGNQGGTMQIPISIDTQAPSMAMQVLEQAQPDGSYMNHAPVSLGAEDAGSGLAQFRYRVDDGPWTEVGGDILVQGEGVHLIACYAVDAAGNNASMELAVEIVLPLSAPTAVQELSATVSSSGILLTWSPSASGLEASYLVFRSVDGEEVLIAEVMAASYLDENVSQGQEYDYRVVPVNNVGDGPSSQVKGLVMPTEGLPIALLLIIAVAGLVLAAAVILLRRR
jgi:hypothetical protein